jgi:hypothetical protein
MTLTKKLLTAGALAAGLGMTFAAPASAYVTCNRQGDCWHVETRLHFPGVTLSFHDDSWWERHRHDRHYSWHDFDNDHDWHHGYWDHGEWHRM